MGSDNASQDAKSLSDDSRSPIAGEHTYTRPEPKDSPPDTRAVNSKPSSPAFGAGFVSDDKSHGKSWFDDTPTKEDVFFSRIHEPQTKGGDWPLAKLLSNAPQPDKSKQSDNVTDGGNSPATSTEEQNSQEQ